MSMSKKHYMAIAGVVAINRPARHIYDLAEQTQLNDVVDEVIDGIVDDLCGVFGSDNPRFDWDRFKTACRTNA